MISDILNGIILFFVIGIFTILVINQFRSVELQPQQESITFYDYPNCEKLIERPPQKTIWGDIGQGYDCLD